MKLLDTLMKKRDHHLAMAEKFSELIAVVRGDTDFAKHTHSRRVAIMDAALLQHASNGNGNGHEQVNARTMPPARKQWSAAARKKQAAIMRKRWKTNRAKLLKGLHKNAAARVAARKAAEATTT
jgi:hypothetical protein